MTTKTVIAKHLRNILMMDVQTKKNPEVAAAKVKAGNTEEQLLWETYTAV